MSKSLKNESKKIQVNFKPRASLLFRLGDQLIKNESIALVELVKNSYDADAKNVRVCMENVESSENGVITIEDDGYGMDMEIVKNVWMEPGNDYKEKKFKRREVSPKFKRLPIGEKGIGRFGVHKLGNVIEMLTKKEGHNEISVKINWDDFNTNKYLEDIPIILVENKFPVHFKNGTTGTKIIISSLRKEWSRGVCRNVKRTINSMVSPFESDDTFFVDFQVIDRPEWFENILEWRDVSKHALFNFRIKISGKEIIKFYYEFSPWDTLNKLSGRKIDWYKGKLNESNNGNDESIEIQSTLLDENNKEILLANHAIGDIEFNGYIFDRDNFIMRLGVIDKKGLKEYLDRNGGIRVFRDGLRVYDYGEPENDWLGIDLKRVNQPTKKLSNNIVLGAIFLKRESSEDLIEKTNREGFVENQAYNAFKNSILYVIKIIENLRYIDKILIREQYGPTAKSEPVMQLLGDLKEYIEQNIKKENTKKEIYKYLIKIENDYNRITENLLKAAGAGLSMSVVVHEVEKILLEVSKLLKKEHVSNRLTELIKHLSNLIDGYTQIIRNSTITKESIKDVIKQALVNTEYRCDAHKIEIVNAYLQYNGKTKVAISRSLLIGTLMNLIDNSIYWLERSKNKSRKIYFGIEEDELYLRIIIADNGTGFLLPTDKITEPFVSAKPDGIGLGLHIAREVLVANKGMLEFPQWGDFDVPIEFKDGAIISIALRK